MQILERIFRKRMFWFVYFPVGSLLAASLYFEIRSASIPGEHHWSSTLNPTSWPILWPLFVLNWSTGWAFLFDSYSGNYLERLLPKPLVAFLYFGSYLLYFVYLFFAFKAKYLGRNALFIIALFFIIFTAISIHGCSIDLVNSRTSGSM